MYRITFKVGTSGVYGRITFLSPKSYLEIRTDLWEQGKAHGATEEHSIDCGMGLDEIHTDYDCYDSEIFYELCGTTPCLINDLTFMGDGLRIDDDHPNLRFMT